MCFVVDAVTEKNTLLLREDGPHPRLPSEAPELHAISDSADRRNSHTRSAHSRFAL